VAGAAAALATAPRRRLQMMSPSTTRRGAVAGRIDTSKNKWWEAGKHLPNLHEIHDTPDFLAALGNAGDKLVIVDFYAQWCGACRGVYPKIMQLAERNEDIVFLKVEYDENKSVCKSLGVKMLPYFHVYRGQHGRLASFSASVTKVQRIRDAIAQYGGDHMPDVKPAPFHATIEEARDLTTEPEPPAEGTPANGTTDSRAAARRARMEAKAQASAAEAESAAAELEKAAAGSTEEKTA